MHFKPSLDSIASSPVAATVLSGNHLGLPFDE
jgi:hypothetical protein